MYLTTSQYKYLRMHMYREDVSIEWSVALEYYYIELAV